MNWTQRLRASRFFRDSVTLQAAAVFNNFASLACTIALAYILGSLHQGEFYLAIATYSFLWFTVNLGMYPVATSQIAAAAARENDYKIAFWTAYLVKAMLWIGVGFVSLAALVLPWLCEVAYDSRGIGWIAVVMALTPVIELPKSAACAAFQGTRRMLTLAKVENGQELVRVFLVVGGAMITGDAMGPALGMLGGSLAGSVLALEAYRRESSSGAKPLPTISFVIGRVREAPLLHGLRLGLRMGLAQNLHAYGVNILPSMVLGIVADKRWVAYMRLAQRFVDAMRTLMQGINRTALPYFSELVGMKDISGLSRAYWRATFGSGLLISTGVLLSIPIVPYLIEYFPSDYRDPVWTLFLILAPGVMVVSFSVANDTFYLVTNTLKVAVSLGIAQFIMNLVAIVVFSHFYPMIGPALALTLFFFSSVIHPIYAAWWFRRYRRQHAEGTAPPAAAH